MKRPWTLITMVLLHHVSLHCNEASIAGVTYMDHFDFEERYRNVNECNPLYWHPLHLPEECLQKFEMLLRSKLRGFLPYGVVEEMRETDLLYPTYSYDVPRYTPDVPPYSAESSDASSYEYETRELTPFEVLFELIERDMRDLPQPPTLGASPYLGLMALYRQPVSYKSAAMIKKLAEAYAKNNYFKSAPRLNKDKRDKKKKKKEDNKKKQKKEKINKIRKKLHKYPNDAMNLLKIKELK